MGNVNLSIGNVNLSCCASLPDMNVELTPGAPSSVRIGKCGLGIRLPTGVTKGEAVAGIGVCYGNVSLEQDAAYWEVRIERPEGRWCVGVGRDLVLEVPLGGPSDKAWFLSSEKVNAVKGDVIGIAFTQADLPNLRFFYNNQLVEGASVSRIRGMVSPIFSVEDGVEIIVAFDPDCFVHKPPRPHCEIRTCRGLI